MQSALNPNLKDQMTMISAEELRNLTTTKEEIYTRQKTSVLENIMESMVKGATQNGISSYSAKLQPQFDPKMLAEIIEEFKKLGYTVTSETKAINDAQNKPMAFIEVTISWAAQ